MDPLAESPVLPGGSRSSLLGAPRERQEHGQSQEGEERSHVGSEDHELRGKLFERGEGVRPSQEILYRPEAVESSASPRFFSTPLQS